MFPTSEIFDGSSYEIVAWARRERVLMYQTFGSYQGDWVLFSFSPDKEYKIYRGSYGSCSGCDSYQATFDYLDNITVEKGMEFAKDYIPFLIVPQDTMKNIVADNALMSIMPANERDGFEDVSMENVARDLSLIVRLEENMNIGTDDIINAPNAELKQRALKNYGYEKFVKDTNPEVVDIEGENQLLKIEDIVFVYVKDSSTPRRYLLRVPPNSKSVHDAIAWTFNIKPSEYQPLIET